MKKQMPITLRLKGKGLLKIISEEISKGRIQKH